MVAGVWGEVLTNERYRTLADSARVRLENLGCDNVEVMLGDGFDVPASVGTFDRIIVTAAMEQIPEALTQRLGPAGILLAPGGAPRSTPTPGPLTVADAGFQRT